MFDYRCIYQHHEFEVGNRIVVGRSGSVYIIYLDRLTNDIMSAFQYGFRVKSLKTS